MASVSQMFTGTCRTQMETLSPCHNSLTGLTLETTVYQQPYLSSLYEPRPVNYKVPELLWQFINCPSLRDTLPSQPAVWSTSPTHTTHYYLLTQTWRKKSEDVGQGGAYKRNWRRGSAIRNNSSLGVVVFPCLVWQNTTKERWSSLLSCSACF